MLLKNGSQDSLTWHSQTNAIHEFRLDLKRRVDRGKKAPRTAWYIREPITEPTCSQVDQDWGKWNNQVSDNQRSHDYLHVEIPTVLQSEKVQKDGSALMPQRPCTQCTQSQRQNRSWPVLEEHLEPLPGHERRGPKECLEPALICSGCRYKQPGWLINTRNWFLTVLVAGSPRMGCQTVGWGPSSGVQTSDCTLS